MLTNADKQRQHERRMKLLQMQGDLRARERRANVLLVISVSVLIAALLVGQML